MDIPDVYPQFSYFKLNSRRHTDPRPYDIIELDQQDESDAPIRAEQAERRAQRIQRLSERAPIGPNPCRPSRL